MKLKTTIIMIILGITNVSDAQIFNNYFSIEPIYNFNLSKTNLDIEDVPITGYGLYLFNIEDPQKLYFGKSFGFNLFIPIKEKIQIGTGLLYEYKGQSSSKRPSSRNPEVSYMHSFILESYQIPINMRIFLDKKVGIFNQYIIGEFITDVYSKFTAQQFKIDDKYGKQPTSFQKLYYGTNHKQNFKKHFKEKLIRFGFGIGYGISFDKFRFATIKTNLSLRYYNNLLNQDISFAIQGNAVIINLGILIGLKLEKQNKY